MNEEQMRTTRSVNQMGIHYYPKSVAIVVCLFLFECVFVDRDGDLAFCQV